MTGHILKKIRVLNNSLNQRVPTRAIVIKNHLRVEVHLERYTFHKRLI